jgi:multidrug efflux pump subunit AcrB
MTLSEICVRRPVFATMLVSACVAFGALSFGDLGVDQYPDVEVPVVTIQTTLRGASPEEIETQVTKVIEDAVSTAEGIDELTSTSLEGISIVTVNFVLERDRDQATQDVRDKVAAALSRLRGVARSLARLDGVPTVVARDPPAVRLEHGRGHRRRQRGRLERAAQRSCRRTCGSR